MTAAHHDLVVLVPKLAQLFGVPTDALLGVPGTRAAGKRGPPPKFQHQLERLQRLPKAKQKLILELLDGVLLSPAPARAKRKAS